MVFLWIYVIFMIYIILGCGARLPELAKWMVNVDGIVPGKTVFKEIVKAILIWPWFDINQLRKKYST